MQDLSLHILDLVQNSIRAKAKLIDISIVEDTTKDQFLLVISDNGSGMDSITLQKANDPFFTSRTTRDVGLGLSFMQMMANLCNGSFLLTSELGKGTTVQIEMQHSHIDRLPLGDMAESMMILVGANPQIDFKFTHKVNNNQLDFSTLTLREVLLDVPLDNYEVLQFIKSSIQEETNLLYGGAEN